MHLGFIFDRTGNIRRVKIMIKSARVLVATVGLIIVIEVPNSFAQFGGRGGLGGIFGGTSRGARGNTQNNGNSVTRPIPDSYEQTEHRIALMEADLHLTLARKITGISTHLAGKRLPRLSLLGR